MSRYRILCSGLITSLVVCHAISAAQPVSPSPATVTLTITGTITNLDELQALVVPETLIQLVPLPADGSYSVSTDNQGRLSHKSDLPTLSVPKKPAFSFTIPNVPPGKYFLAAQRLKSQGMTAGQQPIFVTSQKKPFIIEVLEQGKTPFSVTAGALIVWTH